MLSVMVMVLGGLVPVVVLVVMVKVWVEPGVSPVWMLMFQSPIRSRVVGLVWSAFTV